MGNKSKLKLKSSHMNKPVTSNSSTFKSTKIEGIDMLVLGGGLAALAIVAFVGSGGGGNSGTTPSPVLNVSQGTSTPTPSTSTPDTKIKDSAAFVIGESMNGKRIENISGYRPMEVLNKTMNSKREYSTISKLNNEVNKVKNVINENQVGSDILNEVNKIKNSISENITGELPPGTDKYQLYIGKNGIGQMKAPYSDDSTRNIPRYSDNIETTKYQTSSMISKTEEANINSGSLALPLSLKVGSTPKNIESRHIYNNGMKYADVVEENNKIQLQRNRMGFKDSTYVAEMRSFNNNPGYNGYFDLDSNGGYRVEKAQANDLGSTSHSFETPGGQTMVGQNDWNKKGTNWEQVRGEVLSTVKNICRLFDRLFTEEIFPDAVIDKQDNGQVYIRDRKEGKCIRVDRYYEYVTQSIIGQLSLGRVIPLPWGRSIEPNFNAIDKNKDKLRDALTKECSNDKNSLYIVSSTGEVKSHDGKSISVNLPWPKDGNTLYNHPMVYKKQE